MTTNDERIAEWLSGLPHDAEFSTADAYERYLARWPNAAITARACASRLTRSGAFRPVRGRGLDRVWRRASA